MITPSSTLVIHAGALGDFVLTMHAAERVRCCAPAGTIQTLCRCRLACYLSQQGLLSRWKFIEARRFAMLWRSTVDDAGDLQRFLAPFDAVISLLGGADDPTSQRLRSCYDGHLVTLDPELRTADHVVDQWSAAFAATGLATTTTGSMHTARPPATAGIFVHPGSGGLDKCWPLEHYEQLVDALAGAANAVSFMVGPDELERHGPDLVTRLERRAPVLYHDDVCDAARTISAARLYVGNDAGMTHVAAMLGIPTIQIFMATDPQVWRALGPVTVLVRPEIDRVVEVVCGQ